MFKKLFLFITLLVVVYPAAYASNAKDKTLKSENSVLVIGATGRTGRLVVAQLQERGIPYYAGVRDLAKGKQVFGPKAPLIQLDVTDKKSLLLATKNITHVISTASANARTANENIVKAVEFTGNANLAMAAKQNGIQRVVLVSSLGVTHKDHFLNRVAHNVLLWKYEGEKALRASGVDYTIVRPGGLKDGPRKEMAIAFMQGDDKDKSGFIHRSDVAKICIEALFTPAASRKTFETILIEGPTTTNFAGAFKDLKAD